MELVKILAFLLFALFQIYGSAEASSVASKKSTLYTYQNSIEVQEEFMTSTLMLGWVTSGTTRGIVSVANHPGLFQLDTSAVAGTFSAVFQLGSSGSMFPPALPRNTTWNAQLVQVDANTTARIGEFAGPTAAPNRGIFFEKLDADVNWFCVLGNGGVFSRTDSGVPVNTSYHNFSYRSTGTSVSWSIDNVAVCGSMSTNYPATDITPAAQIVNSAAAVKLFNLDYFQILLTGLSR